jgi:DnaA family protein
VLFSPQLPLPLHAKRHGGFSDFVVGPNAAAVEALRAAAAEPDASVFLSGPESSGKTHLLNAACYAAREAGQSAFYLGLKRLPGRGEAALQGLEDMGLVCIDDLHRVAGLPAWEEALFHFINRLRQRRGRLLVASQLRLSALPLVLPDLLSRLGWGLRLELQPLEDQDKVAVMHSHAESLGIELPEDVVAYLLRYGQRTMGALLLSVGRLQHVAFTEKRRITVPLAKRVLELSQADSGAPDGSREPPASPA